jgi:UDP-N-acetylmuramyl pentapeptide synthase
VAGESIREISDVFINDLFKGSKVIIPEEEINDYILRGIHKNGASLVTAGTGVSEELGLPETVYRTHIRTNLDAVVATARLLGISDQSIIRGILDTKLDIGQLNVFRFHAENRKIWLVNAFAANDPVSTRQIMNKTRGILAPEITSEPEIIGLVSLRSDRSERSSQWLDYLKSDGSDLFSRIFVSGIHSPVFSRKLHNCATLNTRDPEKITRQILDSTTGDIIVFGIMNIHGLGTELIDYWTTADQKLKITAPNDL